MQIQMGKQDTMPMTQTTCTFKRRERKSKVAKDDPSHAHSWQGKQNKNKLTKQPHHALSAKVSKNTNKRMKEPPYVY